MIAIEIDGHEYHKTKEQRAHDNQREREIKLALPTNWTLIRFTGSEIFQNADLCVEEVLKFINKNTHHRINLKNNVYAFLRSAIGRRRNITNNTQGKHDVSVQALDKPMGSDPTNTDIWCSQGELLLKQSKYNEAIHAFDKALEIDPKKCKGVDGGGGIVLKKTR